MIYFHKNDTEEDKKFREEAAKRLNQYNTEALKRNATPQEVPDTISGASPIVRVPLEADTISSAAPTRTSMMSQDDMFINNTNGAAINVTQPKTLVPFQETYKNGLAKQEEEKKNKELLDKIKGYDTELAGLSGLNKGLTWGTYEPNKSDEVKKAEQLAREAHPYISTLGELAGFAGSPFTKLIGAVGGVAGNAIGKTASNVAPKLLPIIENPITQNASKAGLEMAGFNTTETAANIKRNGGNLTDNLPELGKAALSGFAGGAILGGGLTVGGKFAKNAMLDAKNGMTDFYYNGMLPDLATKVDDFQFPQLRELQTVPEAPKYKPTINTDIPPQYQQPFKSTLPKINEQLALPPARIREIAGDSTRLTRYTSDMLKDSTPNITEYVPRRSNIEGNINSLPIEQNVPKMSVNSKGVKLLEIPALKNVESELSSEITPMAKHSPEIQSELDILERNYKNTINNIKTDKVMSSELKSKRTHAEGMKYSAAKREIIQSDSLVPVEGGLTSTELANRIKYLKTNYRGKEVTTPNGEGIVTGQSSFGKVGVKVGDKIIYFPKEQIQPKVNIDEVIAKQKQASIKPISNENIQGNIKTPALEQMPVKTQNTMNVSESIEQHLKESIPQINNVPPQPPIIKTIESQSNLPIKESDVKLNTMIKKIPELQTPEGQKFAKDFEAVVNEKPDDVSIARANEMLSKDYKGTFENIMKDGIKTKEDNLAAWKITRDLLAAKDFDTADALISKVRPMITDAAQIVQSMAAVPKDSLEGIALNAKKVIDSTASKIFENKPNIINQINNEAKIIQETLRKNMIVLPINLQLFAETVDKELKQTLGKLYKKDYINSIINLAKDGKLNEQTLTNAIKQKYGIPTFDGADLEKITNIYESLKDVPKNTWNYKAGMDSIDNLIKSKLPKTLADKLSTYQFINLYMNTITPMKILGGNVTSVGMEYGKNVLRHIIDKAIPGKTVTEMPSIRTQGKSILNRTKEVYKDWRNEVDTDPFRLSHDFDTKGGITFNNKFMREAEKFTKFILSVTESPYKQAIYDDELRMMMKNANVAEPTAEMMDKAMEQAQKVMFANKSKISNAVSSLRNGINDATNTGINKLYQGGKATLNKIGVAENLPENLITDTKRFGIGNLVQPVIKTPINMVSRAVEYSPLNLLTARNREQFVDKLAKAIIGSVFGIGAGYLGKKSGLLTGGTPLDSDARNFAENAGRQPYALNVGGRTYDINYIQPFGMLLSFGAELASNRKEKEWYSPMVAAADSLLNQGMLQGFAKLLGQSNPITGNKAGLSENLADAVTGGANTMIPFSSALNELSKLPDPYKRDTSSDNLFERNLVNKTMARTPLRFTLSPKINNQGEAIKEDSWYNTLLMPGKSLEVKNDPVTNELMRLYDESNQTKQFPPKASDNISYKTSKKGESQKMMLPPKDVATFKSMLGQSNMKAIQDLMNTADYQNANDKQKADLISSAMSKNKQEQETNLLKQQGIDEYKSTSSSRSRKRR